MSKVCFVALSGGVDSAVTAALLVKALDPEQIYAIHVDSGFMRKNESDVICENLKELGLKNLIRENAKDKVVGFLGKCKYLKKNRENK